LRSPCECIGGEHRRERRASLLGEVGHHCVGAATGSSSRWRARRSFLGAIVVHGRAKDPKIRPAAAVFLLSAAALVLRIVTM
jgi:hypothetical protein